MSYSMNEIRLIVGRMLQSSHIDAVLADICKDNINGQVYHNNISEDCRRMLKEFVNDTTDKKKKPYRNRKFR